jgi:hypothetical protein
MTDYRDFIEFRVKRKLPELVDVTLEKTYTNIKDYVNTLILEDYFSNQIDVSVLLENVPTKVNQSVNKQPNTPSNQQEKKEVKDSYGKVEDNSEIFKRMAIPIAGSVVGFGAREAGIRKGLFTGITQKKVEFTSPEAAKNVADSLSKDSQYSSLLGNVKNVEGAEVTISQDTLNKALVNQDITPDMIKGGADGIKGLGGDMFDRGNIGNMAAGTLTGVAASMATNMAINAIRRRIQRNRERKLQQQQQTSS